MPQACGRAFAAKVGADAMEAREQLKTERQRSGALTLHSGALQQARALVLAVAQGVPYCMEAPIRFALVFF